MNTTHTLLLAAAALLALAFLWILRRKNKTLYHILRQIISPKHGLRKFLSIIEPLGSVLDVGCGNDSPYKIKKTCPKINYTGLDVGNYNQTKPNLADHYILTQPENFTREILQRPLAFDTVISSHNLEHCYDRDETLNAMIQALKPNGYLYLSFPTEKSIHFPSRKGTLNYYDDDTHQGLPPNFEKIISCLKDKQMTILFARKSYKPFKLFLIGLVIEPILKIKKTTSLPTWAFYGFESVIWAQKI